MPRTCRQCSAEAKRFWKSAGPWPIALSPLLSHGSQTKPEGPEASLHCGSLVSDCNLQPVKIPSSKLLEEDSIWHPIFRARNDFPATLTSALVYFQSASHCQSDRSTKGYMLLQCPPSRLRVSQLLFVAPSTSTGRVYTMPKDVPNKLDRLFRGIQVKGDCESCRPYKDLRLITTRDGAHRRHTFPQSSAKCHKQVCLDCLDGSF